MNIQTVDINLNESLASTAFTQQADKFDELYSGNTIIQYKRKRVRDHLSEFIVPGQNILELNSGTGEDAIWLAEQHCHVHATDISVRMMQVLQQKVEDAHLEKLINSEICSFTALENLKNQGPYDLIFSNFAGLNCTGELDKVLASFTGLLKPKGIV